MKKTAILGATGMVGQQFVRMLENHPQFVITCLAASENTAGKKFGALASWDVCSELGEMEIKSVKDVTDLSDLDCVFSALPSKVAEEVEKEIAEEVPVFSNASAHRYEEDVPIVIPEVNEDHLALIDTQKERRDEEGFIVTNSNCSTAILALSLKAISPYGINSVHVATMQSISGAGFRGLHAMEIVDNVIPYIQGEEKKIEREIKKIFGTLQNDRIVPATFKVLTIATRIPVLHGHTEAVFVELEENVEVEELLECFEKFDPLEKHQLPSYRKPILYNSIPQPRLHRDNGDGMTVTVGRLENVGKKCSNTLFRDII